MKRLLIPSGLLVLCAVVLRAQAPPPGQPTNSNSRDFGTLEGQKAFVAEQCVSCHNDRVKSGDFAWSSVDLAHPERHPEQLEKVVLKLRAGLMPPAGPKRPDDATLRAFAGVLEAKLDAAATVAANPGRPALHRLNRAEYANSVRDILGVDADVNSLLPADELSRGYPNMADVLTTSPALIEGYVRAGGSISRLALGDPAASRGVAIYTLPRVFSQLRHVEGTPYGTRGGTSVVHNFPADAEYVFRVSFYYSGLAVLYGKLEMQGKQQVDISVDGERVALLDVPPQLKLTEDIRTPRIKVSAGPHRVSAAFIALADGPVDDVVMPPEQSLVDVSNADVAGITAIPHLRDLSIDGPHGAVGVTETPSRHRLLTCTPTTDAEELPCAVSIINRLARQAFRRPVSDVDTQGFVGLYKQSRRTGTFEDGLRTAVQALLTSPEFLFRFERTPAGVAPGQVYPVSDLELASRLSFFLWSSTPDDELLNVAAANRLRAPGVLEAQVRRMLADQKSEALATVFASHWLHLQNLRDMRPDSYQYPDFDMNLMSSMQRETQLFFDSIVREDRSVLDLLTADYTFVDGRLARHYGMPNVLGNRFRRVAVTDDNRRGLLGQASILTLTSYANRTSPVLRGKWVMDVLLGTPPPKPPPNVPALQENAAGGKHLSVRARLEAHRQNPACAACHRMIDPLGFALENYDVVGLWRTKDSGEPVNATAQLVNGTRLDGPKSLRDALMSQSHLFVQKLVHDLTMYGIGRVTTASDMPAVRAVERAAAAEGYRFSSVVLGIVKSVPFQMRKAEAGATTEVVDRP